MIDYPANLGWAREHVVSKSPGHFKTIKKETNAKER